MVIQYKITKGCITIYDSYKVKNESDMLTLFTKIRYEHPKDDCIINRRSFNSMVNEWKAHNLLYDLNLFKSHTKDLDLDYEPWYRRSCYYVLSKIYNLIY